MVNKWRVRKASETQYEVINEETGAVAFTKGVAAGNTTPDCLVLLNDLLQSTQFQWGDTIKIEPHSVRYACGQELGVARFTKSATIWGYGAVLETNRPGGAQGAYMFKVEGVGAVLTMYGLTMSHHYRGGSGTIQDWNLNAGSTSYGGFIRGEIDVRVGGITCVDCHFKELYWYGILFGIPNKDPATTPLEDDLHMNFLRCKFTGFRHPNGATEFQRGHNMIGADGVGSVTIRDCYCDFNKFWLLGARRIHIENTKFNAVGYENVPGQATQAEYISIRNVQFSGDTWILLRSYGGIHSEIVYGTAKNIVVDGFTQTSDNSPAIMVEPQNVSSGRIENVTLRNIKAGINGIQITNYNNTDQRPKAKTELIKIENYICRGAPAGVANPYLVLVQGTDLDLLSIHNTKMISRPSSWTTSGCVVKIVQTPYAVRIQNAVDIKNVVFPPRYQVLRV